MSKRSSQNTDGSQPSVETGDLNFGLGVGIRAGDPGPQEGARALFLQNPFGGGDAEIYGGDGTGDCGSISIQGGQSSVGGDGGSVSVRCGDGPGGGGGIELIAGTRGPGVLGSSGGATIELQSGGSANARAGILARAHDGVQSIPDFTVALESGYDTGSPILGVARRSRLLLDGFGVFGPGGLNYEGWSSQDGAQAGDGVLFILGDGFDDGAGNASPGGEFRLTTGDGAATAPEKGGDFYVETGAGGEGSATALASGPGGDIEFFGGQGGPASGGTSVANRGGGIELVAGGGGLQSDPALGSGLGGPVLLKGGRAGNHTGGGFRGTGGTASLSAGAGAVGGDTGIAAGAGSQQGDSRGYIRLLDQQFGTRVAPPFAEVSASSRLGFLYGNVYGGIVSGIFDADTPAGDTITSFSTSSTAATVGAAVFSPGDLISIEDCGVGIDPDFGGAPQATNAPLTTNNGIFEVVSHVGNVLTVATNPTFDFCQTGFDPNLPGGGSAVRRSYSAMRLQGAQMQITSGKNVGSMAWQTVATTSTNTGVNVSDSGSQVLTPASPTFVFGDIPAQATIIRSRVEVSVADTAPGGTVGVTLVTPAPPIQAGVLANLVALVTADVQLDTAAADQFVITGSALTTSVTARAVVEWIL